MQINQYSHLFYHSIWEHALVGVALVGRDGRFLAANPAFCRWVEYTEAELKTKRYQEITHPEDVCFGDVMAAELMLGKIGGFDMPKRYLTKFGRVINMMSRVAAIHEKSDQNDQQFVCFLSQMAPLSDHQSHAPMNRSHELHAVQRKHFFKKVIAYWPLWMFALGLVTSVTVQVIEKAG